MSNIVTNNAALSTAQLQVKVQLRMQSRIVNLWKAMQSCYALNMQDAWNNSDGLTPQEVFDAWGLNAVSLFEDAYALKTFINAQVPGTIEDAAPPYIIVFNDDGTVTLTYSPPSTGGSGS